MSNAIETLRARLLEIANIAANGSAYASNWSDEFRSKKVDIVWKNYSSVFRKEKPFVKIEQLQQCSLAELYNLGFKNWDDKGLLLIPLWVFHYIENAELISISGNKKFKSDVDLDERGGCIAYGFIHPEFFGENK